MPRDLRYLYSRVRQLTPSGIVAALRRRTRAIAGSAASEARARLLGTGVSHRALRAALRPEGADLSAFFRGEGPFNPASFFLGPAEQDQLVGRIRVERPEAIGATLQTAEAICSHRFDLLGSGPTALGSEIDWHRDFKSGYRWDPNTFYTRVRYGHAPGADVKVPWELSRFQHLATLGKAYWLTGEERYTREFVAQVTHWIALNRPQFGVNWVSTMEVGIRVFNWLWGYAFFHRSPELGPAFRREFAGSLLAHGRHILSNLEQIADGKTSNHYLGNLVGLIALGFACPGFCEAELWRDYAVKEVLREIERQVHSDGGDYESSIPYHRLVTEMFLAVAILCRRNGIELPGRFSRRLQRMLDFTRWYTKPNGLAPQVGDADNGRLHILADYGTWDPRDHRHLLATGGAFFGREDLISTAAEHGEEALWLLAGSDPPGGGLPVSPLGSRAFPDSGIYIMRDGDLYLLVACGPVGTAGIGNHKHNDVLSFELHADGQDLFVDPGSFLYTPEPAWRNRFRSTAVHNTVMIDGLEQNRFGEGGLFWLHVDATPRCLAWETTPEADRFVGEHDGYVRLADPVIHRREIHLDKPNRSIRIVDGFHGTGRHAFTWNFTLAPGVSVRPAGEDRWEVAGPSARALLVLETKGAGTGHEALRGEVAEVWVSPQYGIRERTSAVRLHLLSNVPRECRFRIQVS
jgi:uncharacterized heparinase superfamily protein